MKRPFALACLALPLLLTACAHNIPYRAKNPPEQTENRKALLDIYPADVRTNLNQFTNTIIAWAGIIRETEAEESEGNAIHVVTTFEHHYFDWEEDRLLNSQQLLVSPRGEGLFKAEWYLRKKEPEANVTDAQIFASPGKLAIVYGVPEKMEDNTVVLQYRYLRIINKSHFSTNEMDYGRFGEPFRFLGKK